MKVENNNVVTWHKKLRPQHTIDQREINNSMKDETKFRFKMIQ